MHYGGPGAYFNYGGGNVPYWSAVGIVNDVGAAAIYGSERVHAKGIGIVLEGVHVENNNACTTLMELTEVWEDKPRMRSEIRTSTAIPAKWKTIPVSPRRIASSLSRTSAATRNLDHRTNSGSRGVTLLECRQPADH